MANKLATLTFNNDEESMKAADHHPRLSVFPIHSHSANTRREGKWIELQLNQGCSLKMKQEEKNTVVKQQERNQLFQISSTKFLKWIFSHICFHYMKRKT